MKSCTKCQSKMNSTPEPPMPKNIFDILETLKYYAQLVKEQTYLVLSVAIGSGLVVWFVLGWYYDGRIGSLNQEVSLYESRLQFYKEASLAFEECDAVIISPTPVVEEAVPPLGENDVIGLIEEFGLFDGTPPNGDLAFTEGDITFWVDEKMTEDELRVEFAARRTVLDSAEKHNIVFPKQAHLSEEVGKRVKNSKNKLPNLDS